MLGFLKPKTAEVLSHWYAVVPHFSTSTQDFYDAIEKELKDRQVPDLKISRIEFSEEGLLSAKRLYLRMTRERLVFDVCAAPFGAAFFFTCRFGEIPPVLRLWQVLVFFATLCFAGLISFLVMVKIFGGLAFFLCPFFWIAVIALAIYMMRNATTPGMKRFDAALLRAPVINAIYEAWFRRETYYRTDTRLMYYEIVNAVVKSHVDAVTSAAGIKLVPFREHSPILGELYKPMPRQAPDSQAQ